MAHLAEGDGKVRDQAGASIEAGNVPSRPGKSIVRPRATAYSGGRYSALDLMHRRRHQMIAATDTLHLPLAAPAAALAHAPRGPSRRAVIRSGRASRPAAWATR